MEKFTRYFVVLGLLLSFGLEAKTIIISDLDDTIKQTNSKTPVGVFSSKIFAEMDTLLDKMASYSEELYVLSASPTLLKKKVERLLKKHSIKTKEIILRNYFSGESRFDYKLNAIKEIMDKTDADVIFLGDDVGEDPEIYAEAKRLYGNRVLAIYIHAIEKRQIPPEMIHYVSSFDVAYHEYKEKRLDMKKAVDLAKKMDKAQMKDIVPYFAYCPTDVDFWAGYENPVLFYYVKRIALKILNHCKSSHLKEVVDAKALTLVE